MGCFLFIL